MNKLVAANWKMHKTPQEALMLVQELAHLFEQTPPAANVVIFPPYITLPGLKPHVRPWGALGAQNFYPAEEGAFTGEISLPMLRACGCSHVLAGHSERRALMGESSDFVGQKTRFAIRAGFHVVLCVGETLEEREQGRLEAVLSEQLVSALPVAGASCGTLLSVAYEPVWAIGTGRVAKHDDIVAAHGFIRRQLSVALGSQSNGIKVIYGGSVKPDNAAAIIGLDNVDGLLVGGASLQAESFYHIVQACQS